MRHRCVLLVAVGITVAVTGCSREEELVCEPDARYSTAQSVQPVQIPDDLSPPDESDAIRLPPDVTANRSAPTQPCLETPPSFFGDQRPGRSGRPASAEPAPGEGPEAGPEPTIN